MANKNKKFPTLVQKFYFQKKKKFLYTNIPHYRTRQCSRYATALSQKKFTIPFDSQGCVMKMKIMDLSL
jgi:hypothetical protein